MEMERGGSAGFHGYRKPPTPPLPTSSGTELPEINMSQLSDINTTKKNDDTNTNTNNDINSVANNDNECTVREQDRFMPIANVIRIMRKILPPHAKISDDAKETIQECVSEYISFITGEANERCQLEQRKTITAEDVLWAMSKLGFDDYIEPLTLYLNRYREFEGDRGAIRGEPLVKRAVDPNAGAFNMAAFAPIGGFHYHHQGGGGGFLGVPPPPPMGGFLKDAPNMASSSQAGASLDQGPYLQGNKL